MKSAQSIFTTVALPNQFLNLMIQILLFHFAVGKAKALEWLSSQPKIVNSRAALEIDQK